MEKFVKNKEFILYLFLLILICTLFFGLNYAHFGMFFVDTSRETYMPMMMNKNFALYKDIFNIFTPLAYQINAFFCHIFGENLNTFYFLGFFNTIIFISGIFSIGCLILKNSKFFSFIFSILVIASCIFAVSPTNYILPYSYSIVYAISFIVWALFCFLLYIKNQSYKALILSFMLFGTALSCKYDFVFFSLVLFGAFFDKRIKLSIKLYCLFSLLCAPLLSFGILFMQGVTFIDLKEAYYYVSMILKSEASIRCYKFLGIIPTIESLKLSMINFLKTIPIVLLISFIAEKINIKRLWGIILFCIVVILILKPIFYITNAFYFNWLGMFVVLQFLIFLFYLKKKNSIDIDDKIFLVLFISVILISIKVITAINLNNYGTYYFPFLALCSFSCIFYYIKHSRIGIYSVLIILSSVYTLSNIDRREVAFNTEVRTEKGVIYTDKQAANALNQTINFISKKTTKNDKILVLPEGAMINFLTNRISDNKYFYLIPTNIEVFGEDKIVKDLTNNLPDYIILQPMSYNNFGETFFCESFGTKICALLPKYYQKPIVFGDNFWIAIYKKQ